MAYQSDVRLNRQKQINTLRVFNDNVTERIPGKEYSVSFTSSGLNLNLILKLQDNFPVEKPIIEITPVVHHPWVDSSGKIDSPGLRNFSQHSDLGMVVSALRSELEKSSLQLTNPSETVSRYPIDTERPTLPPDALSSKLGQLSLEDLKSILEDDDHLETLVDELEQENHPLDLLTERTKKTREEVEEKALRNQDLQRQVELCRSNLICKYEEFHQRKERLQNTVEKLKKLNERVGTSELANRLLSMSADCDEESEEIAENFLQKRLRVEEFLPRYVKSRGEGCMKKVKAEKLLKSK